MRLLECYFHDIGQLVPQLREVRFGFIKRNGNVAAHVVASYVPFMVVPFVGMLLVPSFYLMFLLKM